MELDAVTVNGYQGGKTDISIKPAKQPAKRSASEGRETVKIEAAAQNREAGGINAVKNEEKEGMPLQNMNNPNNLKSSDIKKSIEEINRKLNDGTECIFGIHDETNRVTIKIVDKESKEVIKEIPPEKTLEMIAKIWEFAGILIDQKL